MQTLTYSNFLGWNSKTKFAGDKRLNLPDKKAQHQPGNKIRLATCGHLKLEHKVAHNNCRMAEDVRRASALLLRRIDTEHASARQLNALGI